MKQSIVILTLIMFSLCFASSAFAINLFFLKDRPISNMSKQDFEEFRTAVIQVLDENDDGYVLNWSSTSESSSARLILLNTYIIDDKTCRKFKTNLTVGKRSFDIQYSRIGYQNFAVHLSWHHLFGQVACRF